MISLIIPTKDRVSILEQTLRNAKDALVSIESEIIVVNDSKQELLLEEGLQKHVTIVRNPKQGVASARNFGASLAKGEWLLFMDDDMLIHAGNVQEVWHWAQTMPNACYNINWEYPETLKNKIKDTQFGRFLNHYGFTSFKGWHKNSTWNDHAVFESNAVTSQFLFIATAIFHNMGGYNEKFPFAGFEDYDLTQKLQAHQIKILVYPETMAYHNEVDRSSNEQWLARRKRGGKTRKVAVEMGYSELKLNYSVFKSSIYRMVLSGRTLFLNLLKNIPNLKVLDPLYFFLLNLLYGAYVYEGYREDT